MANNLAKLRLRAAKSQNFRCFYCMLPIWEEDPQAVCAELRIGLKHAALLRSTAEHLVARCDGGRNSQDNIVAACYHCNHSRHAVPNPRNASAYQRHVRRRMHKGRWLAGILGSPLHPGPEVSHSLPVLSGAG